MKNFLIILAVTICFAANAFGENKEDNASEYFISGISTREDIGGVEVSRELNSINLLYYIVFENYNNYLVSVIFEYEERVARDKDKKLKKTGTIVLKANEKKKTANCYWDPDNFKIIVKKLKS